MKKIVKWVFVLFLKILFYFLLLSSLWVFTYRFVNPPISGMMLYKWFTIEDYHYQYDWVDIEKVHQSVPMAFIAAEDQLFLKHMGFDLKAIQNAIIEKQLSKKSKGASTISQQVAKNLFLVPNKTILRKGFEAYFTVLIELFWSKKRIMEMYVNCVELGDGVYGIKTAAMKFYKKSPNKLSRSQAALIATALPNPHRYSIKKPSKYMLNHKAWVLKQMDNLGGEGILKEWYE